MRLSPGSPEILAKAAEALLVTGDVDGSITLSDAALAKAPFNVRALRVRGLAASSNGQVNQADEILTLAGNWSLRDDPSHTWLIQQRLRQGNYASAFAHAETLVRRRPDLYDRTFRLFTTAAKLDTRAAPILANLLATRPPWRASYLQSLYNDEGMPVLISLGILLQNTEAPLTDAELRDIYQVLLRQSRLPALRYLRAHLRRPALQPFVDNGRFAAPLSTALQPFGWSLATGPGIELLVSEDEVSDDNLALRASYRALAPATMVSQLMTLSSGAYLFSLRERVPAAAEGARFEWRVVCLESNREILRHTTDLGNSSQDTWRSASIAMSVPSEDCQTQQLLLDARPADFRTSMSAWYDDIEIIGAPGA
ncbi:hypothetical protein [Brevundimonas kwangchunensis]|uniref:hypothetical protein n=1 Tax=Brevundimonas kwangchunensis TaxID=322163 RepID=UPI0031D53A32